MGATKEATTKYFQCHESVDHRVLGKTGLRVSSVGFGGYRVHDRSVEHEQALKLALRSGCNLIDTSANYTDGGSERLIGKVLRELFASGELKREETVVVTKAGYIQGTNLAVARERARAGSGFSEVVEYSPECWHSISPEFLENQISLSLERLGLEQIDVLLLHNPEYFLMRTQDHAEYYRRIARAFEYLETEVSRGRIQFYGVSSNTFPDSRESREYTSLEAVLELAQQLPGGAKHFAVIQFPLNLFEAGAVFEQNNSGKTLLETATAAGLGTLINRPLNAFAANRMIRLADFPDHVGESVTESLQVEMSRTASLETRYAGKSLVPANQIAWAHILRDNFGKIAQLDRWNEILKYQIEPSLAEALGALEEVPEYRLWCRDYRVASARLFKAMTAFLEAQASLQSKDLAARMTAVCPALESSPTLSRKSLRVYRSLEGVSSILVGMRKPEYVRDALVFDKYLTYPEARSIVESIIHEIE